ncbi:MAG: ABC transporter ATP-binding protein, partial [Clostridia bacterium]|nr:ABC transporter ATP-binding protein [Clostridia bacterium]
LCLDVPVAGGSPAERATTAEMIRDLVRERALAVLLIEHDLDVVFHISHRIVVLHQGRVIATGPPRQVAASPEVQAAYLGA